MKQLQHDLPLILRRRTPPHLRHRLMRYWENVKLVVNHGICTVRCWTLLLFLLLYCRIDMQNRFGIVMGDVQ
jgi:hypothetical protein